MHCQRTHPNFPLQREILNASVTATGAVPSFSPLPEPPSVILFLCVTKHDWLRKGGRSTDLWRDCWQSTLKITNASAVTNAFHLHREADLVAQWMLALSGWIPGRTISLANMEAIQQSQLIMYNIFLITRKRWHVNKLKRLCHSSNLIHCETNYLRIRQRRTFPL